MKYILILSLLFCVGCNGLIKDEIDTTRYEVPGPTFCYLTSRLLDNSMSKYPSAYMSALNNYERVPHIYTSDYEDPRPCTITYPDRVEEVDEYDSCDPLELRSFIIAHRFPSDYFVVHISSHGIKGWGMGPDYTSMSVLSFAEIAQAVNGLGVDILILDGCDTFDSTMIDLLRDTDVKFFVGSLCTIQDLAMSPVTQVSILASHNWTPLEYCVNHWGAMPEAFNYINLQGEL